MKLFLDLKNRRFVKSAASNVALQTLVLKRRDQVPLEVVFVENGVAIETPEGTETTVALKSSFSDSNFLALAAHGTNTLDLYTEPVDAAFSSNPAAISALLEIRWSAPGQALRTATLQVELQNSVITGDEGTPAALPDGKATQAEAEAGTDNDKWMTPLRTAQAIEALAATDWDSISGKPATFPPSSHTHTAADIEDFADAVVAVSPPVDWSSLTGKPAEFPPEPHNQDASTITGLSEFIISSAPGLQINTTVRIGDGTTTTFPIDGLVGNDPEHVLVALNGVTQTPVTDYTVSEASGTITFDEPPAAGMQISCTALGLRTVQPPIDPALYLFAFDQSSDGLTTYSGRLLNADRPAAPALPETATTWTIRRSTLSAAGRILATASAVGAWANRETATYS
jgi:hypothetical protein